MQTFWASELPYIRHFIMQRICANYDIVFTMIATKEKKNTQGMPKAITTTTFEKIGGDQGNWHSTNKMMCIAVYST